MKPADLSASFTIDVMKQSFSHIKEDYKVPDFLCEIRIEFLIYKLYKITIIKEGYWD
ncbi:MAG: hypothetical protein ACOC5T_00600 [Elusimicrobiota bacterium]